MDDVSLRKTCAPELFCSTQSSALAALPWLHSAIHFCKQRCKGARERLPGAACKVGHQRAHVRPARHWLVHRCCERAWRAAFILLQWHAKVVAWQTAA